MVCTAPVCNVSPRVFRSRLPLCNTCVARTISQFRCSIGIVVVVVAVVVVPVVPVVEVVVLGVVVVIFTLHAFPVQPFSHLK